MSGESNTTAMYTLTDRSVPQVDVSLPVLPLAATVTSTEILFRSMTFLAVVTARHLTLLSFLSVRFTAQGWF